jgi:putative DNA methylase
MNRKKNMEYPKKLIEIALPLDDINVAAAREKSIRHGHPSTLHLWWARRPLAAARAVLFAQLVNDPGGKRGYGKYKGQCKADAQQERERLFQIIRDLVKWENTTNEQVLERAREEIRKSWKETCELTGEDPKKMPPFLDPFAGGGSIPLEAQRLGLEAHASDLNPVAVMINKAMIEIPPKFAGIKPVGPVPPKEADKQINFNEKDWSGTKGLAEDVRRYGYWMREEAFKRIGHLYPQADLPKEYGGGKATVIAWLWARTVASPNPAVNGVHVPLISNFFISTKKGKEAWVHPVVEGNNYHFTIRTGKPENTEKLKKGTKLSRGANFCCVLTGVPIAPDYIKGEGKAGRMGVRLMAVVAEGPKGRLYLAPTEDMEKVACEAQPEWKPENPLPINPRWFSPPDYGMPLYSDLFTSRQLVALTTFSDLVQEAREKVIEDAKAAGWTDDGKGLNDGGKGSTAYGDAISVYLAFAVDKCSDYWCSIATWMPRGTVGHTFSKQAIPMTWDFPEANPLSNFHCGWNETFNWVAKTLEMFPRIGKGIVKQQDACIKRIKNVCISTDPPYYDNIGYADLSDFFYIWLRRSLKNIFPDIFSTMLVPKDEELIASPYRHGTKKKSEVFFMKGMTKAIQNMAISCHKAFPVTIYYAFKQSETAEAGTSSTGWETFLSAVIKSGFAITGTWPMRTERTARSVSIGNNALASSIIIVCRKRDSESPIISRKQFVRELEQSLPEALEDMIGGKEGASPIAPVDLAQAAIGPGMAVYSKYAGVLEADGTPMSVYAALTLINKTIDEYFTQAESSMGPDTRFCMDWFQQYGFKEGPFGEADVLARAKGTNVAGVQNAGVIQAGKGKVRLLKVNEYPVDWDPAKDLRIPVWEACHHLSRALKHSETVAGALLSKMPEKAEPVRQLAYRLYTLCERKGWAEDARNYNELITSWYAIVQASHEVGHSRKQMILTFD